MRDPDELHNFARFINNEKTQIIEDTVALYRMMKVMNETWQDVQNAEFTEKFEQQIDKIYKLAELLDNHSKFVELKASQIDEYNRRFYFE